MTSMFAFCRGGMSFCDAHDTLLFRFDPIQQIFNVQRRGVCEDKDMPCESDEAVGKCSDALLRWLHKGSLCYLRVVCCIILAGLPFAGGWQVLGLVNFSQLLDLHFFGAIHFTRFRCSEKGFCVEPSWCPVEAMDGFINLLSVGFLFLFPFNEILRVPGLETCQIPSR